MPYSLVVPLAKSTPHVTNDLDQSLAILIAFLVGLALLLVVLTWLEPGSHDRAPSSPSWVDRA